MKKKTDEVVQVPVSGIASSAGETEAVEPAAEVPADKAVVAGTTSSDDLNDAVGDVAAAGPVAESEGDDASVDTPVGAEPDTESATVPVDDEVTEEDIAGAFSRTDKLPDDNSLMADDAWFKTLGNSVFGADDEDFPEGDEGTKSAGKENNVAASADMGAGVSETADNEPDSEPSVIREDIQEAEMAEGKSPEALTANMMKNPIVREVAATVIQQMSIANGSLLEVCFSLPRTDGLISEKSFRHFAIHIIRMDPKTANDLRGVGRRFWPYVERGILDREYLKGQGISKLITVSRYPKESWQVNENGRIIVSRMDEKRVSQAPQSVESMTVDELRKNLQNLKSDGEQSSSAIEMLLDMYEGEGELACDVVAKVGDKKDGILKQVRDWDAKLKTLAERHTEKIDAIKKGFHEAKATLAQIEKKRKRAELWVNMLTGQNYDWPEGCEDARVTQQKEKAEQDRRRRRQAVSDSAASRL